MQSQQMNPEENRYQTFEPPFSSHTPAFEYGDRESFSSPFGEKLKPVQAAKKRGRWLGFRIVLALISLILLFLLSWIVLSGTNGPDDPVAVQLLLVWVSILSINIIVHLLSHQQQTKERIRQFGLRLAFALISGALLFPLSEMMIEGDNGVAGILLVWVSILSINIISYLTAFSKYPNSTL